MDDREGGLYQRWVGDAFPNGIPPRRPFLTPRQAAVAAVSAGTWLVLILVEPLPPAARLPGAVALAVTFFLGLSVWMNTWSNVFERAHVWLAKRRDLSDGIRLAAFMAAFIGYGVGSIAVAGLALWLASLVM